MDKMHFNYSLKIFQHPSQLEYKFLLVNKTENYLGRMQRKLFYSYVEKKKRILILRIPTSAF